MGKKKKEQKPVQVTCRKCKCGPYTPSFTNDFYEDGVDGPGTGLCERCMMNDMMAPKKPVLIQENYLKVCTAGGGSETCRFLAADRDGYKCAKGTNLHSYIESRTKDMGAKGDNCSGPPDFKIGK